MILGTFVILGAGQWFQVSKKTMNDTHKKEKSLDTVRTILQFITNDLKVCGYRGCRTLDDNFVVRQVFVNYISPYKYWHMDRNIFGFIASPGNCIANMPSTLCQRVADNAEVLVIYNVAKKIVTLKQAMSKLDEPLLTEQKKVVRIGSLVLISDCLQADIFVANNVTNGKIFHEKTVRSNESSQLSKRYGPDAEYTELQTVMYYLAIPPRLKGRVLKPNEKPSFSLYRDELFHKAVEIVEGVYAFQIEYGLIDPNQGLIYKKTSEIENAAWPLVHSVRIHLELIDQKKWSYEFAIGNRRHLHSRLDYINRHLNDLGASSIAGHYCG